MLPTMRRRTGLQHVEADALLGAACHVVLEGDAQRVALVRHEAGAERQVRCVDEALEQQVGRC